MSKRRGKRHLKPRRDRPNRIVEGITIEQDVRTVHLTPEGMELIEEQLRAFKERFGREAEGDDPIFFDPDSDEPIPLTEEKMRRMIVEAAAQAGLGPERGLEIFDWLDTDRTDDLFEEA